MATPQTRLRNCPREGNPSPLRAKKGYGRAYRTGFVVAKGDIIVTMDADCTYPAEVVPDLVKRLIDEDLDFITCDRLTLAEEGSMSAHGFAIGCFHSTQDWLSVVNQRFPSACGFSVSRFLRMKRCSYNDGMPLSGMKIMARRVLGKKKAIEIVLPPTCRKQKYTWGDGWKNLKFIWAKRFGLNRTLRMGPGSMTTRIHNNGDIPEEKLVDNDCGTSS